MSLWHQNEGEGDTQYKAFYAYCKADPSRRTYRAMSASLNVPVATLHGWSKAHDWPDRAAAWDAHRYKKKWKRLAAREVRRDVKRFDDRLKAETRASRQLQKAQEVLYEILIDKEASPSARLGAFDRICAMSKIDSIDMSRLVAEIDGGDALIHAQKRAMSKLNDEDAELMRRLMAKAAGDEDA